MSEFAQRNGLNVYMLASQNGKLINYLFNISAKRYYNIGVERLYEISTKLLSASLPVACQRSMLGQKNYLG